MYIGDGQVKTGQANNFESMSSPALTNDCASQQQQITSCLLMALQGPKPTNGECKKRPAMFVQITLNEIPDLSIVCFYFFSYNGAYS